jgi:hypothetical protein
MSTPIEIELIIVEPVMLELQTAPVYSIGTAQAGPQGEKGEPGGTLDVGWGTKQTGVDAGTLKEISIDDDYLYLCVVEGDAGVAVWKKTVLFNT